jgi:hypothetical protein
MDFSAAIAEWL